ncbi:MAG: DUF1517 domain-containing protein [Pseudanabaena sp. ELA607]
MTGCLVGQSAYDALVLPEAAARSSGGRAGGGSFRSKPSSSGSSSSGSSGGSLSPSRSSGSSAPSSGGGSGSTIIAPVIINGGGGSGSGYRSTSSSESGSSLWGMIFFLILLGGTIAAVAVVFWLMKKKKTTPKATITRLQVALLAQGRVIQQNLTDLAMEADTESAEGLVWLLQETTLTLLRAPEMWTHAMSSSETVKLEAAESLYNRLIMTERTKLSEESVVNVGGRLVSRQIMNPEDAPAEYIVVTLVVGSSDDKPLLEKITNTEQLTAALEKLGQITAERLFAVEVIWSPQDASDSLTYDELLTEYTDLVQI